MATQTFSYNGGDGHDGTAQIFVVPTDVTMITMECWGAEGQTQTVSSITGTGGKGGYIKADIPVSPGETLEIRVGGKQNYSSGVGTVGAYNGGGVIGGASAAGGSGGGGSDVRRSPYTTFDRLIVGAGGGGGTSAGVYPGGNGGDGGYPNGNAGTGGGGGIQPTGATQTAGGITGTCLGVNGANGAFWEGGKSYALSGVPSASGGGSGGGGWYGGGGGATTQGGGGGSSASPGGTLVTHTTGARTSHGQVVFTWTPDTPVIPIEDATEWEVKVFDSTNPNPFTDLLAIVPRWTTLKYTRPLDDVGAGEIQILRDDPVWKANPGLLDDNEHIWAFYENGELRFTMFAEDVDENHVDDQERPVTKISGRDGAKLLQYSIVLPPGYPSFTEKSHDYAFCHAMQVWFLMYQEANVRGAFPTYMTSLADDSSDSVGHPYNDVSAMNIPPGQDLLSLLRQLAPVSEVHWAMNPDFDLSVKNTGLFGLHRGETVVFHVGGSIQTLGEKRTRRDIRSHVFLEGGDGIISEVSDSSVASQWGRREIWLQSSTSKDPTTGAVVAQVTLEAMKNEAREITVLVRPGMANRKVWIDYALGDWVLVEWDAEENTSTPPNQDEVKILAISQEVSDTGETKVELVLNTRLQENQARLNQIVDKFTGAGGATPASQTSSPITGVAVLGVSTLNDLSDVVITSPATGAILQWNGTNWVDAATSANAPPSVFGDGSDGAVTLTQASAAPSGMVKVGSGATTTFRLNRNMYFTDLEMDDSGGNFLIDPFGWRLFVKGTLTIDAGCTIQSKPLIAVTNTGASAVTANTVGSGSIAGNGGGGAANGTVGTNITAMALGGSGGRGGNEAAGTGSAVGGTATAALDPPRNFQNAITLVSNGSLTPQQYRGGCGGGGGDSTTSSNAGGGGGGGSVVAVFAQVIQNSGLITAPGGDAAAATGTGTGAGGGGGGGGGVVILVYASGSVGTLTAPGGNGGAAQGAGTAGANGSVGTTWAFQV